MRMTVAEFKVASSEDQGYCSHCETITTDSVEPDAEDYECPECGNDTVMGLDTAILLGHVEVVDEDSDEDLDGDEDGDFI